MFIIATTHQMAGHLVWLSCKRQSDESISPTQGGRSWRVDDEKTYITMDVIHILITFFTYLIHVCKNGCQWRFVCSLGPERYGVYYTLPSVRYSNIAMLLFLLPGFDVLGIELCHVKVKGFAFGKIGNEDTFDLFIKNDLSLYRSYPAALVIKDHTIVKVIFII